MKIRARLFLFDKPIKCFDFFVKFCFKVTWKSLHHFLQCDYFFLIYKPTAIVFAVKWVSGAISHDVVKRWLLWPRKQEDVWSKWCSMQKDRILLACCLATGERTNQSWPFYFCHCDFWPPGCNTNQSLRIKKKCLKSLQLVVLRQFLWCCRFHCFCRHCINSLISETTISSVARRLARHDWRTAEPFKDTLHVLKHWILLTSRGHYWRKWLCNLSILQLLQMTSCLTKRYIFQQFLC